MKTNKFLSAVSAVAIIGASSFALAQGAGGGAGGSAGGGAAGSSSGAGMSSGSSGAGGAAPSAPGAASQSAPSGAASGGTQAQGTGGMSGEKNAPSRAETPADRNAPARAESPTKDMNKSNQAQDQKAPAGNAKSANDANSKSGSTVGSAQSSGGGSLTTEQRTVVREKVLATGPRVTNVNFSINVGTVVPSSVRVVVVPQTIIDIRPEWRGYRYFVANDEIIIVEPKSLKIVAVWPV